MTKLDPAISDAFRKWEEKILGAIVKKAEAKGRKAETRESFATTSGIEPTRVALPDSGFDYIGKLGFPGEYPFTRGVQPTGYRGRFWTMRQYAGFGTARDTNQRYHALLKAGQTGLSVAFDLPTQQGFDSDDPVSAGEVGKVGVSISSLADMETLFEEIELAKVSTSMTINATAAILLAMYIALAKKQGADVSKLAGTIQNDVLKEYVARHTDRFPLVPAMRLIRDTFEFCSKEMPTWNMISISGYHIREAGSNAVQEVAFTLANGMAYVQMALDAGMDVDKFAGRLSFFFGSHNHLFEEAAKFRAARRLWAKIMKERFGAKSPRSMMLRFHTQTAGCALTAQQYNNNVVRVAMQALAATLGGTNSLHTNSRDEALALPTEESVMIALRTQQLLAEEHRVGDSIDPLAGSYYVEALTDEIEKEAEQLIAEIDDMGGAVEAVKSGWMEMEIRRSAYEYQKAIESKDITVVGVNKFTVEEEVMPDILRVDPAIQKSRAEELKKLRAKRDSIAVKKALAAVKAAAEGTDNLMPPIISAVEVYTTIGEICSTLSEVFGESRDGIA
ncbi:MAG: acyl-CoA mutase large subunit family protein [Planctomycetota bacterium]|jgi:methylmalonyl-CoA mutase N-terminal domain/subunit